MTPRYRIDGEIGVKVFAADVAAWLAKNRGPVDFDLHTDGGSITEGIAIYNTIRAHAGLTTVRVTGVAGSMGSIILQAFDVRKVAKGAFVMVHNPAMWGGNGLEADSLRSIADRLQKMKVEMLAIYSTRSGRPVAEIEALITKDEETWLTAEEAVAAGLADSVEADLVARGLYQMSARSKSAPKAAAAAARLAAKARADACVAGVVARAKKRC